MHLWTGSIFCDLSPARIPRWPCSICGRNSFRATIHLRLYSRGFRAFVSTLCVIALIHEQNVNRFGGHPKTSQTLRLTSPVLLSTSNCSQAPLELSKVLSDSARAFSGAPEGPCIYGVEFRMLRDLTYTIFKFWISWDLCEGLRETTRAGQTTALLCGKLDAVFSHQRFLEFHNRKEVRLSYSSLLQSQDSLHHNMACIIQISLYIYIWSIWPQMVVEHNRRSSWRPPLRKLRDAPFGGHCGETTKQEERESTINAPLHLSRHPRRHCQKERFWL